MPPAASRDRPPLVFSFRNLGPIREAELELGDLTIIAGRNNTGKTYLVYTLYGFLKTWEHLPAPAFLGARPRASESSRRTAKCPVFEEISQRIADQDRLEVPVDRCGLNRERTEAINYLTGKFSESGLADVFSSSFEKFQDASIDVKLSPEFPRDTGAVDTGAEPEASSFRYGGESLSVTVGQEGKHLSSSGLRRILWRRYLRFLFPELQSDPFVLSAERFGISLFYRELDFQKSHLVDLLQKYGERKDRDPDFPFLMLDEVVSRYARPIKDNIDFTRSIPDLRSEESEFFDGGFLSDIKTLMNGYYAASGEAIEFRSVARGERRFVIPLHLASSSARGLSDLYFFLRHVARRDHLLIIDEPESHLDTANQILLARLLARLVRAGLRVVVTTHSDYIIKELNNLIMLSSGFGSKASVIKRLGYGSQDCIAPESIRAYIAEKDGVTACAIDKFGIDMPNFDRAINQINEAANELYIRLAEESGG